jgi:hypothetical protein
VAAGQIPESQLTDDEKETVAQISQQGQEPSAMDQALIAEAEARTKEVEAKTADTVSRIDEREDKFQIEVAKLEQKQDEAFLKFQKAVSDADRADRQQIIDILQGQAETIKTNAESLKILREAMGVDTIVGPTNTQAYKQQADIVVDTQQGTAP